MNSEANLITSPLVQVETHNTIFTTWASGEYWKIKLHVCIHNKIQGLKTIYCKQLTFLCQKHNAISKKLIDSKIQNYLPRKVTFQYPYKRAKTWHFPCVTLQRVPDSWMVFNWSQSQSWLNSGNARRHCIREKNTQGFVWKTTQPWVGSKSCFPHTNLFNLRRPLQSLILRYTVKNF